jgi:hypothetical protein
MNIFILHLIPLLCAQMHADKHVIKMILETTQMLCSAHHMTDSEFEPCYKLTHKNHPCSVWARTSKANYVWLCQLGLELCKEYTYRYGKIHKCEEYLVDMSCHIPPLQDLGFTKPAQAMPDMYKDENTVEAYRAYYLFEKHNLHSWSGKVNSRSEPEWVTETFSGLE